MSPLEVNMRGIRACARRIFEPPKTLTFLRPSVRFTVIHVTPSCKTRHAARSHSTHFVPHALVPRRLRNYARNNGGQFRLAPQLFISSVFLLAQKWFGGRVTLCAQTV
jgi:hypothetical protein